MRNACSCSRECLPFPVSSEGRPAFVTPHPFVFSSAAIISAGGPLLFLLRPSPTGLLSLKAAVSSILLSTSLYLVLLSKLQLAPSSPTCIYNVIIQRHFLSLNFRHGINPLTEISTSELVFPIMNPLIHSTHLSTWNIHECYLRIQAYKILSSKASLHFISNSPASAYDMFEDSH